MRPCRVPSCLSTLFIVFLLSFLSAAQELVQLSWNPSTSQVIGYNVYRGTTSGGPYTKINSSLDAVTSYGDKSIQAGDTYYYVTTAVDSTGKESGYSNQTQATIPNNGSGAESTIYSFAGGTDPNLPFAGLIVDTAGNLYGTTELGGSYNQGTVFELTRHSDGSWTEAVLYSFSGGADGAQPTGGLLLDSAGNLYGTTTSGGGGNCSAGCGTIFKLAAGNWNETVLYTFAGSDDGREPYAGLISDTVGNLYGTTVSGGSGTSCSSGCGTVFELSPTSTGWSESVLYNFIGGNDGASPYAAVLRDNAGNLYGTTYAGGTYNSGTAFKLSAGTGGWSEAVLHVFTGGKDGGNPYSSFVSDGSGNLYGTAFGGGSGYGIVFELQPSSKGAWREKVLHAFGNIPAANPVAGLVMDTTGSLYGTTMLGGGLNSCGGGCGTVFRLKPVSGGWKFAVLHIFGRAPDGYHPSGVLVSGPGANLYGTTQAGGTQGTGVVFEIAP